MTRVHEYDIQTDTAFSLEPDSPCPGRVCVLFARGETQQIVEMEEKLFIRVARKFIGALEAREKNRKIAESAGSRATRTAEPKLADL